MGSYGQTFPKKDAFNTVTDIKQEVNLNLSTRTICRWLVESNLNGRSPRYGPYLRKKNINDRLNFAKIHIFWDGEDGIKKWSCKIWSDETKINLFSTDGRQYVRRPVNKEFGNRYTKKKLLHIEADL